MRRNAEGKPVYLGGFMASGKTSVGRELSRLTGYPFLDMDEAIEMRTGMAVWEIFAELKEPAFRDLERKLLREIASLGRCIAALGGGVGAPFVAAFRAHEEGAVGVGVLRAALRAVGLGAHRAASWVQ